MLFSKFYIFAALLLIYCYLDRSRLSGYQDIPTFHSTLTSTRSAQLELRVARGEREPFLWPLHLSGLYIAILYFLAPPSWDESQVYLLARFPVFAVNVAVCIRAVTRARSHNPPIQYGIGLITSFACLWLAVHLLWRNTRRDGRRIIWVELRRDEGKRSLDKDLNGKHVVPTDRTEMASSFNSSLSETNGTLSRRTGTSPKEASNAGVETNEEQNNRKSPSSRSLGATKPDPNVSVEYYWQALPDSFVERVSWVCTILLSLRGEGTNYGIAQLPAPPPNVRASLSRNSPEVPEPRWISETKPRPLLSAPSRSATLAHYLRVWAVTYLILDISKQLMLRDAYFTGLEPLDSPLGILSHKIDCPGGRNCRGPDYLISSSPSLLPILSNPIFAKSARLLLCISAILALLTNLTALPVLLFYGLRARDRPWLYPTMFGHQSARDRGWGYITALRDGGIAGWWGKWWHQMFRLSFEAPASSLCAWLSINPRGILGKLLSMIVAFTLSAALHAAGSATLNGPTQPWRGSGAFFLLQPVGIVLELCGRYILRQIFRPIVASGTGGNKVKNWLAAIAALIWVHAWFYVTAPLLADDVAAGGVWTTEVVPVSLVDALLLSRDWRAGAWWRWERWMMPRWHTDPEAWWRCGVAF